MSAGLTPGSSGNGTVRDELAVRDLVARFADAVNRRAYGELATVWAPEGVWEVPGFDNSVGLEAITGRLRGLLESHEGLVQLVHSGRVWLMGDVARGRWYISEITRGRDGVANLYAGVYHDQCRRTPEGWRFVRRRYDSLFRGRGGLEASVRPFPDLSA